MPKYSPNLLCFCLFLGLFDLQAQEPYDYRFSLVVKGGVDIPLDKSFYQFDNESILQNTRLSFSPEVGIQYNISSNFSIGISYTYFQLGGFQSLDVDEIAQAFQIPLSAQLQDPLFQHGDTLSVLEGFNYFQAYIFSLTFYKRFSLTQEIDRESRHWFYLQGHIGFSMVNRNQRLTSLDLIGEAEVPAIRRLDVLGNPCDLLEGNCPKYDFVLLKGAKQVNGYLGIGYNMKLLDRLNLRFETGFMYFFPYEGKNIFLATNLWRLRAGTVYHFKQKDRIFTDYPSQNP